MNIVFLAKYLPPYYGGMEKTTRLICEGLRSSGHHVQLVGVDGDVERVEFADRIIQLKSFGNFLSQPLFVPTGELNRALESADLIIHNFPHPLLDWYALRFDRPRLTIFHAEISKGWIGRLFRRLEKRLLEASQFVTVSSPQHLKLHALKPFQEKCRIIPFGIPVGDMQLEEHDFILSVGRLVEYKGHRVLVDAMRSVKSRLIIVGSGPEELRLKRQVAKYGICHRVSFLKDVSDEELRKLYACCKLFVLPSITAQETFGMSLAEAMSFGKPVITTNLDTGVNFVNHPDRTGLVVQRGDSADLAHAINKLLTNQDQRRQMGARARQRVIEKFRLSRMVDAYTDVIGPGSPTRQEPNELEL